MRLRKLLGISAVPCGVTDCSRIPESCVCRPPPELFGKRSSTAAGQTSILAFRNGNLNSSFLPSMEAVAWIVWTNTLSRTVAEFKPAFRCSLNVKIALTFFWQVQNIDESSCSLSKRAKRYYRFPESGLCQQDVLEYFLWST